MSAGGPFGGMRGAIARIIDPDAFDATAPNVLATGGLGQRQAAALEKAEKVIALEFSYGELPEDLQEVVDLLEPSGKDLLVSSASAFAPMLAEDGSTVFTGLIRPMRDGSLLIAVLTHEGAEDEDDPCWVVETATDDKSRALAAQLDVIAAGGGTA